jgi:hypothetical protein
MGVLLVQGWTDVSIGCPGDRRFTPRSPMVTHLLRQSRGTDNLASAGWKAKTVPIPANIEHYSGKF